MNNIKNRKIKKLMTPINLNLSTILIYQNKKDFNLFLMDYYI